MRGDDDRAVVASVENDRGECNRNGQHRGDRQQPGSSLVRAPPAKPRDAHLEISRRVELGGYLFADDSQSFAQLLLEKVSHADSPS
jgi:hypothetical protein